MTWVDPLYEPPAWADAASDPAFREEVAAGLEDIRAGRTRPWSEIREPREVWLVVVSPRRLIVVAVIAFVLGLLAGRKGQAV